MNSNDFIVVVCNNCSFFQIIFVRKGEDLALYEDVGTICTVLPATPRRETHTE